MLDRREKNIEVFENSVSMMKNNIKLKQSVTDSIRRQTVYLEPDTIAIHENQNLNCKTVISQKRSFEAASEYAREGKKVCVLNFASATNPGGGVTRGSTAQEECLCRCSTLYPCLNNDKMRQLFYNPHRKAENPLYNDDCIYTPDVTVFKTDTSVRKNWLRKDWYRVDVLTCAAPNLRRKPSNSMNPHAGKTAAKIRNSDLYDLLVKRITRIFQVAIANGTEILVLGAFGCGAFCNPPMIVARAFRNVRGKV
ncbi:MAG: TIGR02452 family protein [Ruminococcus sp.]